MSFDYSLNIEELLKKFQADLDKFQQNRQRTLFQALTLLEAEILNNIRTKSGLKVRSGSLLNSVSGTKRIISEGNALVGFIGSAGVPYARIHEFGGKTSPHLIRPRNADVLAFISERGQQFAKFVNHPGSEIPARPYLMPALDAKKDEILQIFGVLIQASFK